MANKQLGLKGKTRCRGDVCEHLQTPRCLEGGGSCEGAQSVRAVGVATGSPLLCAIRTQLDGA